MSSVQDLLTSLIINSGISVALVGAYAVLSRQPLNKRVYFAKKVKHKLQAGPQDANPKSRRIGNYININPRSYFHIFDWIKVCLSMSEEDFIREAGLDSAVYLRMLLLGMQIFLPMVAYSFVVLVPINVTENALSVQQKANPDFTYSSLDTITISNIPDKSSRLWAHIIAAYLYTIWTCYLLNRFYSSLVGLRFKFLSSQDRKEDQFTILCRCIPTDEPIQDRVRNFFGTIHEDHYLFSSSLNFSIITSEESSGRRMNETSDRIEAVVFNANKLSKLVAQKESYKNKLASLEENISKRASKAKSPKGPTMKTGFCGLYGEKVVKLDYYRQQIEELTVQISKERGRLLLDEKAVKPAAFVSFDSRWAAAVCSQTRQSKDSATWLTEWAPEPRDVYWANLPVPYLQLNSRKVVSLALLVVLVIFYIVPVSFVQSLANLDYIEKKLPFLNPLIKLKVVKWIVSGFLPGLALKIFLLVLPLIVWYLAVFEGHVSYSRIEKHACINYLAFLLVIAFLGNVLTGTAFQQLQLFINTPTSIPSALGNTIPFKATFFMTYIMVDGWTNVAVELFRVISFIIYHSRSATMLHSEAERDAATPVDSMYYITTLPRLGLYFLLGFVYSTISPLILPFILVYLAVAYVVYRNQMINVYDQKYETAGSLWPVMFAYVIIGLLVMDATLIGVMALKHAAISTPFLIPLPICTILFWFYCRSRFEDSFRCYPLQEAKEKDDDEKKNEPSLNKVDFLETAYMHPALRTTLTGDGNLDDSDSEAAVDELLHRSPVRPNRHNSGGSWSNGRGSPKEQKLRSSGSLTPTRPLPSGSSSPHRSIISQSIIPDWQEGNGYLPRSPNWQGSNRYIARNISDDDESSRV